MKRPHKSYHTITEAAKILKISRQAVHEAIKGDFLEADWGVIGPQPKGWRIAPGSLRAYEVSLSHQQRGKKNLTELDTYQAIS